MMNDFTKEHLGIDIRIHYWPNTPDLREVKLIFEGKCIRSTFVDVSGMKEIQNKFCDFVTEIESAIRRLKSE